MAYPYIPADAPADVVGSTTIPFSVPGEVSVGVGTAGFRMQTPGTIESVESLLGVSPSSNHIVDLNKRSNPALPGTTLFTNQADRPTIAAGEYFSGRKVPAVTTLAQGDILTVDVDEVGVALVPTYVTNTDHAYVAGPTTTYNISRHAETVSGDLLIVSLVYSGVVTWSASGFTQIGTHGVVGAANTRVARFWRVDNGAAGPHVFTASGSALAIFASSVIYRGAHATVPIESATQADHGAVTDYIFDNTHTTINNNARVLVEVVPSAYGGVPAGPPIAHTGRKGFSSTAAAFHVADILIPTAGPLGSLTVTLNAAQTGSSARIGIRPSGAAAVPGSDLTVMVRYSEI